MTAAGFDVGVCDAILDEVLKERLADFERSGSQSLPAGTGNDIWQLRATDAEHYMRLAAKNNQLLWMDLLNHAFTRVGAQTDDEELRVALLKLATVSVEWMESIDSGPEPTK